MDLKGIGFERSVERNGFGLCSLSVYDLSGPATRQLDFTFSTN
jgi:hypothetical protein